jgi:hypothetical protein
MGLFCACDLASEAFGGRGGAITGKPGRQAKENPRQAQGLTGVSQPAR